MNIMQGNFTWNALLLTVGLTVSHFTIQAQENRTYNGLGNNIEHPTWGALGTNQLFLTAPVYSDGVSEPGGLDRPNPRFISNAIFNQEDLHEDEHGFSDYAFVWGQFIDHDITLVGDNHEEQYPIEVPNGDPYFDPYFTGEAKIPLARSASDETTGTSEENPRAFPNIITSFIDASNVYGSTEKRANWLRSFVDGKLRTSEGNLLPYNTLSGEKGSDVDLNAPMMANPFPQHLKKYFVAGDIRANENILLTAMHTLFLREHNRLCEELKYNHPSWDDETIYQKARKINGGIIQSIVFNEWLPTLKVHLGDYSGYDKTINPGIMNVFSAAAYRYGHTVINSRIVMMDNDGEVLPNGEMSLRDAFFRPEYIKDYGIEPFFIGMGTQVEQDLDCKMIHDLRNFLFGAPGSGGMDLASINIQRGRERGLADYNSYREVLGVGKLNSFEDLTGDEWFNLIFSNVYKGEVDKVDPWVGFLAERHMGNTLFGETVMRIMELQFGALRDGDRFYFENDNGLTDEEKQMIATTTLKDVLMRNTDVNSMQDNLFRAEEHPQDVAVDDLSDFEIRLDVFPNPVAEDLFVNVAAYKAGEVTIKITDARGVVVEHLVKHAAKGMNTFEFKLNEELPSGFYQVTLVMENRIGNQQIFKK